MGPLPDIRLAGDVDPHPRVLLAAEDDLWDLIIDLDLSDDGGLAEWDLGEAES